MAKRGRPRKDEGERGTRQIRVFEDLADMIAELTAVLNLDTAVYVDTLLRPDVERKCKVYEKQIQAAREARRQAEATLRQAQQEAEAIRTQEQRPARRPKAGS